jgi:hypothetical protein
MMENKEIIVAITVPSDQVEKATAAIQENTEAVERLKTEQEILAKTVGKTDQQYIKNAATIKRLNGEIRQNERTLIASEKATKANDGSIRALREQLSAATAAYNNMSREQRDNTKEGQMLKKQTRALSDELKQLEGAVGNNTRNVGNYSASFKEAIATQKGMGASAVKLFDVLKANPIMFIVSLVIQLIQKIGEMQSVTDALNSVLVPINTVFQRLVGILQDFVSTITKALTSWANFREALKSFSFKKIAADLAEAWKEGERLAAIMVEIQDAQIRIAENEQRLNREFEEAVEASRNINLSAEQRAKAAEKAVQIAEEQKAEELNILNLQIEQLEIKLKQNATDRNALLEITKLRAQRDAVEADSLKRTKRVREEVRRLEKQQEDERRRAAQEAARERQRADEAEKRSIEQQQREREAAENQARKDAEATAKQRLETALKVAEQETQIALNTLKRQLTAGEISREQYEESLNAIQSSALLVRQTMLEEFTLSEQELLTTSAEFQEAILADITQKRLAAEQAVLDARIKATDEANKREADAAAKLLAQKEKFAQDEMAAKNQILANTIEIFGRESAAGKAVASFQAALNSYQAFTAAIAQFPGPIGAVLGATNLALGLVQVARINATPPPQFADGVIGLDGAGNSTSDSIDAKLSRGESVMTAKATSAFAPVLAQMEKAVGNRPNYNYKRGRFASGVIGATGMAANFAGLNNEQRLDKALENITIVTKVTDIDRVNKRRERVARITDVG